MSGWMQAATAGGTTLLTSASALSSGIRAKSIEDYNAEVLKSQAVMARKLGKIEQERQQRMGARRAASIQASGASAGLTLTGSLKDVFQDQIAEAGRESALTVMRSVYSGELLDAQAELRRMRGRDAYMAGLITAASTLAVGSGQTQGAAPRFGGQADAQTTGQFGQFSGGSLQQAPSGQMRGFSGGRFGGGV